MGDALFADKYRKRKRLGEGAMCDVFLAEHTSLDRPVALKILKKDLSRHEDERQRFLREARTCSTLHHPNIVEVYEVGIAGDSPFIAMEYVDGVHFGDLVRQGLSLQDGLALLADVADALGCAHDQGVVHRDLKPENILVSAQGKAKVADWGLSKATKDPSRLTRTGIIVGTPDYMAPEQIRAAMAVPQTDLYALGVILYAFTAGRLPFEGEAIVDVLEGHVMSPPPPLRELAPWLPDALCLLVEQLLAKNPGDRPSSAATVAERIRSILPQIGTAGRPTLKAMPQHSPAADSRHGSGGARTQRSVAPRFAGTLGWRPFAAVAAVALALIGLAGLSLRSGRRGAPVVEKAIDRSVVLRRVRLLDFDRIELRFRGPAGATFAVDVLEHDGHTPAPQGRISTGADGDVRVARTIFARPLHLRPPLRRRAWLRLHTDGGAGEAFLLDPTTLMTEIVAPLQSLPPDRLAALINDCERLRENVGQGKIPLEPLPSLLKRYGIEPSPCTRLEKATSTFARTPTFLNDDVLLGMRPLLLLEAALASPTASRPPWGWLAEALGLRFAPWTDFRTRVSPAEGERIVGSAWLVRRVHDKIVLDRVLEHRLWMGTATWVAYLKRNRDMASFFAAGYRIFKSEGTPTFATLKSSASFPLDIHPPRGSAWPLDNARLGFIVDYLHRRYVLEVRINGGRPYPVVNTSGNAASNATLPNLNLLHVSLPIRPSELRPGRNTITLHADQAPGPSPRWLVGFSEFYVSTRP